MAANCACEARGCECSVSHSFVLSSALVLGAWPAAAAALNPHGYAAQAASELLLLWLGPLYVMWFLRSYPSRTDAAFMKRRLAESCQYTVAIACWAAFATPFGAPEALEADALAALWQRALPFFLGLNFSYLDRTPLRGISFTAEGWKESRLLNSLCVLAIAAVIGAQVYFTYEQFGADGDKDTALFAVVLGTLLQDMVRIAVSPKDEVHVHHYYVGGFMALLCWGAHPASVFLAHLFWGVYVEGVAAWGRDPTFLSST